MEDYYFVVHIRERNLELVELQTKAAGRTLAWSSMGQNTEYMGQNTLIKKYKSLKGFQL